MDRFFKPGMKLQLNGIDGTYVIHDLVGRGSSCVVYRADFYNGIGVKSEHLLKEFNPKNINVTRTETFTLQIDQNEENIYEEEKQRFKEGFEKQVLLREKTGLKNYTANIQNVYEDYNTVYIDMNVTEGKSYDTVVEKSIYDLARRMKVLAEVVGKYHENGYLHLDLKPNNIYVRPDTETCEDVLLFDFDSVIEKSNLQAGSMISYTKDWAALELTSTSRRHLICEATDIFSIGEIFFEKLLGRHSESWERRTFSNYTYDLETSILENINPKVVRLLDELFRKTLCNNVASRYQSTEKLISLLDEIIKISNPEKSYLKSSCPEPLDFFVGRERELQDIHEILQDNKVLFLSGMGGIGKSELAKNYAKQYGADYDTTIFVPYVSDLNMAIADDNAIPIYNFHRYPEEKPEEYARRKFRKVKELCDNRVLIIVDNFDCMDDPLLSDFLKLNADILVTTRMDFSEYNRKQKKIGEIQNKEIIFDIFRQYYTKPMSAEEFVCVEQIIDLVCSHTMTIELLAKQMMAGRVKPDKMLETLRGVGIAGSGKERINFGKDDRFERKSAYEHIQVLFAMTNLNEKEEYVLMNLSIIPYTGIPAEIFYEWCELESYDTINRLSVEGWIRLDKLNDIISLHPVVAEVVFNKGYNNDTFLKKMLKNARETLIEDFDISRQGQIVNLQRCIAVKLFDKKIPYRSADIFIRKVCAENGDYFKQSEVVTLLQYVVSIRESSLGITHDETMLARYSLANVLLEDGKFLEAKAEYEKILDNTKRQYHFETLAFRRSPIYRKVLRQMSSLYCMEGKYVKSEIILQRLIGYTRKNYNNDDARMLIIQQSEIWARKKQYNHSVELLKELFVATETDINNEKIKNHELMLIATTLSMRYIEMSEYENALLYASKAYDIYISSYGTLNKQSLLIFETFARANILMGNFTTAEEVLGKLDLVMQELYGPEHFKKYKIYLIFSELYERQKEYGKAWKFVDLAKRICLDNQENANISTIMNQVENQIEKLNKKIKQDG